MQRARLHLSPPHLGGQELEFVREAFASNYIAPLGPMVDAFEREFADYTRIPHCLALASGTAAMHLALRELGVGPGDEVLASTLTFIGSVSPATFLGASVAFIDADAATWNMDPALLSEELAACARRNRLPKAVIPTDLYGQCCDLERIRQICDRCEIPVVADAAEAMGAKYQRSEDKAQRSQGNGKTEVRLTPRPGAPHPASGHLLPSAEKEADSFSSSTEERAGVRSRPPSSSFHAGYYADAAVFSFNGNKILTTSGGGMLASHDARLIEHARKLSQQAREPAPHYEHLEIGYNYRMSNILAALGRGQLRVLDKRVRRKREIFEGYRQLLGDLPGVAFMPEAPYCRSNRWLTVVLIHPEQLGATSEQVRLALEEENIESRPIWKPMHLQPVFKGRRVRSGKVSEHLFRHGLCLPSGTAMSDGDIERVATIVRRCRR
jgi:dTDP-4-amino-4,6-dideoxygalactose transaminase